MTAQIAERLRYQGQDMAMCTEPLGDYLYLDGTQPSFEFNCTALWRGYVGSWEIEGAFLVLAHDLDFKGRFQLFQGASGQFGPVGVAVFSQKGEGLCFQAELLGVFAGQLGDLGGAVLRLGHGGTLGWFVGLS